MYHVKLISILLTFFVTFSNAGEFETNNKVFYSGYKAIKVFDSTDKNGEFVLIYKYDVNKNGKLDIIKVTIPEVININGTNISESSTEDLTPYLTSNKPIETAYTSLYQDNEKVYKDEFYEIQLDTQEKYPFVVRLYGVSKNEEWEKDDNPRVKFIWADSSVSESKDKNLVISTSMTAGSTHEFDYYLKIDNKKLLLTKLIEHASNYKDCTYRFKKGFELKMIDTANVYLLRDKALNKCKEQSLDGY